MMEYPLTLQALLRRAAALHADGQVVGRRPDGAIERSSYGEVIARARRLAGGLLTLGVVPGDRVATLCWSHREHLEAFFGAPLSGAVLHTLNPRLSTDDLAYIVRDAGDRVVIVDESLLDVLAGFRDRVDLERIVVVGRPESGQEAYEDLIAGAGEAPALEEPDELAAVAMCYTSGTTGRPKGVVYSHRSLVLHSLMSATVDALAVGEEDRVLPVAPMFHANAWGLPYTAALTGAALVLPGSRLDPESLLELIEGERVTIAAGVPTVWLAVLEALDADPQRWDVSSLRTVLIGGAAAPPALIDALERRHGLHAVHSWGMTETAPVAAISRLPQRFSEAPAKRRLAQRARQGRPVGLIELRARADEREVPWDGETMGELEVRGPWVAASYHGGAGAEQFTGDGWFRTGDIVTIDGGGSIEIRDRTKDLIKSGGEWISSVALESALMGHPEVAEAAVIAMADERWGERPLAVIVARKGCRPSEESLRAHLATQLPRWCLPDRYELVEAIPRTAAGKFLKSALRERFAGTGSR